MTVGFDYRGYKQIDANSWDFGQSTTALIKVSSHGLKNQDKKDFFTKRAAAITFEKTLNNMKLADGEYPVHLIALGATEYWNANRNGDGFTRDTLKQHHPTFIKHAKVFRDHDENPAKAYGRVVDSAYNDDMNRVELLIVCNGNKKAASKNNGLVMPESTINKLASGKEVPFSMGAYVKTDICSGCGNGATIRPSQYCTEETCVDKHGNHRFGCRYGLCKVAEDGFVQYVDNPKPVFIDISEVYVPADRTAYGYLAKYSADHSIVMGGSELAQVRGIVTPDKLAQYLEDLPVYYVWENTLHKLAAAEHDIKEKEEDEKHHTIHVSFCCGGSNGKELSKVMKGKTEKDKAKTLMELADSSVLLSPEDFFESMFDDAPKDSFFQAVQDMFGHLHSLPHKKDLFSSMKKYDTPKSTCKIEIIRIIKPKNKMTKEASVQRMIDAGPYLLRNAKVKKASFVQPTETDYNRAIDYCLYKIAACSRMAEYNGFYEDAVFQQLR
jgi:hypothetical protein